jgi:hypothetical protein
MTNSVFFVVVKSQALLKYIHSDMKADHSLKIRFGDYIQPSTGRLAYHIENGQAWRLDDEVTLTLLDNALQDQWIDEGFELDDSSPEQITRRPAARTYRARSDASVGSIKGAIEQAFGLPEGSVALCAPDGKHIRADAKIKTLRGRWGEE